MSTGEIITQFDVAERVKDRRERLRRRAGGQGEEQAPPIEAEVEDEVTAAASVAATAARE